mgnify:CR=1 FL=1
MAVLSDNIEQFIKSLLNEYDEMVELQRNELASYFSCAPSQINYVLATRFSPEKGYYIESKRGGGGYIKLTRVDADKQAYISAVLKKDLAGGEITEKKAMELLKNMESVGYIDPAAMWRGVDRQGDPYPGEHPGQDPGKYDERNAFGIAGGGMKYVVQ